jgi:hypothetical protein
MTPVTLATQEAENRRIKIQSQHRHVVHMTLSWKYPTQKVASGVDQVAVPA